MLGAGDQETIQVDGVVVLVDEESNFAYLDAGLGRVLLSPVMDGDDIKVSDWFSVTATPYRDAAPIHKKNFCRYAVVGRVKKIKEKLPTGSRIDRDNLEVVRIQTPVMIGAIREDTTVALSEHIGRVFIDKKFRKKMDLKSKMILDASVQSCDPSDKNAFCFWSAKALATSDELKTDLGIRECLGRFSGFMDKNLCLIELFGENEGFVCARPPDFAHAIPMKKLKEAEIIVVCANQSISPLRSFPVSAGYAYVPEGDELESMKKRLETLTGDTNSMIDQGSEHTRNDAIQVNDENRLEQKADASIQSKCIHSDLIRKLMSVDEVKSQLQHDDPELYERVVEFLGVNNV
ncbi:unnamed protein product [Anisakis simplex]|uniref:CPSF_A domain-containing protein n=1 Tax=Anisakis simplex TaxID=6269 RepID=A0A0M3K593_ANISI|nr:unnamed protein product [Anisakis simplex]